MTQDNLKKYFLTKLKARPYLKLKTPLSDSLSGGIQTVMVKNRKALEVSRLLMNKFSINCRPMFTHGLNGLRISLAIYISLADIDYLFESFDWLSGE